MSKSSKAVKVAFIGAGAMGTEHAKAFAAAEGTKLVGITSRTREKAEKLAGQEGIEACFDSIPEMMEKSEPDLVVIAVPEMSIRSVAEAAFSYPAKILMEKPPGHSWEEANYLHGLAEQSDREVYVALNRRFYSSTTAGWADLKQRDEPRFIRVEDQQSLETARVIGHPPEVVRNWMYANSIHLVDYLRCFGRGSVTEVNVLQRWDPDHPQTVVAHVRFDSGDTGLYEGIWNGPGPWGVTVSTPSRWWEFKPLESGVYVNAGERQKNPVEISEEDSTMKAGFASQAREVLRTFTDQENRAVSFTEAMESMKLVHDIFGV
jgi:predicted dehydrogenase